MVCIYEYVDPILLNLKKKQKYTFTNLENINFFKGLG